MSARVREGGEWNGSERTLDMKGPVVVMRSSDLRRLMAVSSVSLEASKGKL